MVEFKFVINDVKTGKSIQKVMDGSAFLGKRIGEKVSGHPFGLGDYELQITGGSDYAGFPMRADIQGIGRKKALLTAGAGLKSKGRKGRKARKTVAGNTIHEKTAQVNLKVIKYGEAPFIQEHAQGGEKKDEI
ncbi:30S ribosomal protein S6e [archaeon]|nr:30S ribosomal protein S6e [archaeon]